jgi:hypothetical protein
MNLLDVLNQVSFEQVKKELLLSNRSFGDVMDKFEAFFSTLGNTTLGNAEQNSQIVMNRESFETAYYIPSQQQDVRETLTTFVPCNIILASPIKEEDLSELDKALIVAGALCLLTFNGTAFSEEEREREIEATKEWFQEAV